MTVDKRILLLGATFATDNMGVGALASGAITALRQQCPRAAISLLDYGARPTATELRVGDSVLKVPLINLRFSWKIFLPNNVALLIVLALLLKCLPAGMRGRLIKKNRWLDAITQADSAVAISGGDSFSDIYGMGRLFYVLLPQVLLIALGKNFSLLPQTIGPFEGRFARFLARFVMRRAQVVFARDLDGVRVARELLSLPQNDAKVRFCHDLGFLLEPRMPVHMDIGALETPRRRPLVGLNVSGLLFIGGYGGKNDFRLNLDYRKLISDIVTFFLESRDADVLLVPHVFGTSAESDVAAVDAVFAEFDARYSGRIFRVRDTYDQSEIKHIIGMCDFFVGARMHACIAALSQSIPAVAIAYSRKFIGVLESIGAGDLVADPRHADGPAILGLIDKSFGNREQIRRHLEQTIPAVRREIVATSAAFA